MAPVGQMLMHLSQLLHGSKSVFPVIGNGRLVIISPRKINEPQVLLITSELRPVPPRPAS